MTLPLIPTRSTDTVTHQKRVAESINDILQFKHDDWRTRTAAEQAAGVYPANSSFPPGDVRRYGAIGDGVTDNADAIDRCIASLPSLAGAYKGNVQFGYGEYITSRQIVLPNGVTLRGAGPIPATSLKASNTFNATSLVTNELKAGNQEYASIIDMIIDGNDSGGAVCSTAVVDFVSLFVNSGIHGCLIQNGSNDNLRIGANNGGGPFLVDNTWVLNAGRHNVVIDEDAANTGAVAGIYLRNCTLEHHASNSYGIYISGIGGINGVTITDVHIEQANYGGTTKAIYIDGASDVRVDGAQIQAGGASGSGVVITNNTDNNRIKFENVTNINVINPIIDDQRYSVQYGAVNVPFYSTPDFGIRQQISQTLTYGTTVNTNLALGNYCIIVANNGTAFTIANPTNAQLGERLTYEIVNTSGGAMGAITWGANFVYRVAWVNPANGFRRTVSFVYRAANSWIQDGLATTDM